VQQVADDVIGLVKASLEIWPTLVEICYFQKSRRGLPQIRVQNQRAAEPRKRRTRTP
jgi:hypothetical protein